MAENNNMAERLTRLEGRMDGHEAVCLERWTQLRNTVTDMTRGLRRLEWTYYVGVAVALGALVKAFWLDKVQ